MTGLEQLDDVREGGSRVDDILYQIHVTVSQIGGDVLDQDHRSRGGRARAVAGDLDEINFNRPLDVSREIGQEIDASLENPDEDRRSSLEIDLDLTRESLHHVPNLIT